MLRPALVNLLLILALSPAHADDCSVLAARIAAETGATIEPNLGTRIQFTHSQVTSLSMECSADVPVTVGVIAKDQQSAPQLIDLLARAAAIAFEVSAEEVRNIAESCQEGIAARPEDALAISGEHIAATCITTAGRAAFEIRAQ